MSRLAGKVAIVMGATRDGNMGQAIVEDVANAALFAVSDECFMTGQTFQVNGGLTLRRNPTAAEIQSAAMGQG